MIRLEPQITVTFHLHSNSIKHFPRYTSHVPSNTTIQLQPMHTVLTTAAVVCTMQCDITGIKRSLYLHLLMKMLAL